MNKNSFRFNLSQVGVDLSATNVSMTWTQLEKFAELMIEDCLECVIECDPSTKMTPTEPYATIVDNIKQYFGWID